MNFKQAVEEMKKGKKVRRKDWKDVWYAISSSGHFILRCTPNFYNKNQTDTKIVDLSVTDIEDILADDWEIIQVEEEKKWWKPEKRTQYYVIHGDGDVERICYTNNPSDNRAIFMGNCFKTEEEAKFMVEKLKIIHELEKFAYENNEKEIDWNDVNQTKYYLGMFQSDKIIDVFFTYKWCYNPFNIYFTSEEIAEKAIETIGEDRIKKYYFGVNEDGRK